MSLDDKVLVACHRIEELYHETDGKCFISFSGGKDSTVILALTKLCVDALTLPATGIKAVFINTGIEMGVTVDFVKWCKDNWYPNIEIIRPEHPFAWVLDHYGKPMKSKLKSEYLHRWKYGKKDKVYQNAILGLSNKGTRARAIMIADKDMHLFHENFQISVSPKCCEIMKKKPSKDYAKENGMKGYAYGTRMEEGGARFLNVKIREQQGSDKICTSISGEIIKKAPIIDWTEADVDEFIERYNVPLSKAYTEFGFTRTGCCACPFALDVDHNLHYLHDNEPNRYKAMMFWLKDVYIAQNVKLPFDPDYEKEREEKWANDYEPMRQEMLRKYRPNSRLIKQSTETKLFY